MPNEDNRIYLEFPASSVQIGLGETITFDNISGFLDSGRVLYDETSLTDELAHLENDKADADSVYTKTEIDNALNLKADKATTYTKTEIDVALDLKADKATLADTSKANALNHLGFYLDENGGLCQVNSI